MIKKSRWKLRRNKSANEWGREVLETQPIVFVNAIPKSGSHLLTQIVEGLISISPLVDTGMPPVNRGLDNVKLGSRDKITARLAELQAGDFSYGYLNSNEHYLKVLSDEKFAVLFLYRDPRDVVVSQVKYATQINERHDMREYYHSLDSEEACLNAAIRGVDEDGYKISSILRRYENYLGWVDCSTSLPIQFEKLILERDEALIEIVEFLMGRGLKMNVLVEEAVGKINEVIRPEKSGTFRKGEPGGWRDVFTEGNKIVFKEETGDLLMRLGYEENMDW